MITRSGRGGTVGEAEEGDVDCYINISVRC